MIKLSINNKQITCENTVTILEAARANSIEIPSLCHDERVKAYGSCGICTVEIEGNPRLVRACSTLVSDGMVITTESERILNNRRLVLELLLSDHIGDCRAPCTLNCPASTDCQGYVRAIANGDYTKSLNQIREKIPFPAAIGRVCPHPCESACRRGLVDKPIAIANLKQFAAENIVTNPEETAKPHTEPEADTNKSVGIIGGGPGGLSAAYYLRLKGHSVTVYDKMPKMGGMLRYGIPEYRLPKAILQKEIDVISDIGVCFKNNTEVKLDDIKDKHDCTIVAIGAWKSSDLRCKGEELDGVIGGIDFLRSPVDIKGKKVAVVGGGNTAMDTCRTAVRLGASEVYCIYRRTRDEMPAEDIEIEEAIEEGVIFKFLVSPVEIKGENNRVRSITLQTMELGEPDGSGRRFPVPVEGEVVDLDLDFVISAIGQKPNVSGYEALGLTKWGTISADFVTFSTEVEGVFAIGDATNKGADIAISAIGEAGRCARVVDMFLKGNSVERPIYNGSRDFKEYTNYLVKNGNDGANEDYLKTVEKIERAKLNIRNPEERKNDFKETFSLFDEESARREASRCLECGCSAYRDQSCNLIKYANIYNANPEKIMDDKSKKNKYNISIDREVKIVRNNEKCILCGLCVRICDEVEGLTALGFSGRGFDTSVLPALGKALSNTSCNGCDKCIDACPTGALAKNSEIMK